MHRENPVFIPGPTNIPGRIRKAMDIPTINHRAPGFAPQFIPLFQDLKRVFQTETGEVLLFTSTGTGGWEAAITNTLSPGDGVLTSVYGVFAQRWADLCERHHLDVRLAPAEWGEGVPVDEYERILSEDKNHQIKAVLVCHNETSTGVTSDVAAVRRVLDKLDHPALLMVDGISSIASIEFRMDEWGVDVAVAGSQKGFMLAAGMAVVAVSPRAMKAYDTAKCGRAYFDFRDMHKAGIDGSYPYTPPTGLISGFRESISMLFEEGLPNVYARHHRIAEGVRRAVAAWGMSPFARRPELYSNTVTAVTVPEGFDSSELVKHAYNAYGVAFGGGLGQVAGKVFRIGHLGAMSETMMLSGIATIEMAMGDLGYPIELGSGTAAAQAYYGSTRDSVGQNAA